MKILLASIGTRGDMEPFLAVGEILQKEGHEIICLFPQQFQQLVEDCGFQFESLGSEFIEMLESDVGKYAMGGAKTRFQKIQSYIKLASIQSKVNRSMVEKQYEVIERLQPDRIVHSVKVTIPVIWEIDNPGTTTVINPLPYLHYVKGHSHLVFRGNYGTLINKFTFSIAEFGLIATIKKSLRWLSIDKYSKKQIREVLQNHKIIYTVSPTLFPRPKEWPSNMQVLGYHQRDIQSKWTPSPELQQFLDHHEKILFVTFGSMINPTPNQKTKLILEVLEKQKIPAIINTSSGGLIKPKSYNQDLFFFVQNIPYDYIFPKMYAIVHHGGSGTTHLSVKYSCPSLIIPHIIDQFVWNDIIAKKELGPQGISMGQLSKSTLETPLSDLWNNRKFKENVDIVSKTINEEQYTEKLIQAIVN